MSTEVIINSRKLYVTSAFSGATLSGTLSAFSAPIHIGHCQFFNLFVFASGSAGSANVNIRYTLSYTKITGGTADITGNAAADVSDSGAWKSLGNFYGDASPYWQYKNIAPDGPAKYMYLRAISAAPTDSSDIAEKMKLYAHLAKQV